MFDRGIIVIIVAGAIIGVALGIFGLNISMSLWWYLDIPLIILVNIFRYNIADFFIDWYKDIKKGGLINIVKPEQKIKEKRKSKRKYI
jgi:hypothetical protein